MTAPLRGSTAPLSIAPMMACTDRHYRYLMRQITRHTLLYTEMVHTGAILRGRREDHLQFDVSEHPVALQLGGDDPAALAACAQKAEALGYDEVNINVGCPSDRVSNGCFGASLMARPERVAECVAAMRDVVAIPVTVKHRIGIDDIDTYEHMLHFVDIVSAAGADRFTVHARKAWLKGLSPKENRNVPPLRYADVYRLKAERPHLPIEINGGIRTLDVAETQLAHVDAVMIGRAAYDTPWIFADADARFFGATEAPPTRHDVVRRMLPYIEREMTDGTTLHRAARHMLGLFAGQRGAKRWKRHISEGAHRPGAGPELIEAAADLVPELPPTAINSPSPAA
ncbi:MAG: tRNA dihydrouridine(20/20a) synthase DusA [Deltaproteobacteria bacterium]|nr:tRNA dihydrouridine(20/20a) synthase DusA [Deltaproteobacteria bacterium]